MLQSWRRMGYLPSFFVPTPEDLIAQESPPLGLCQGKKNANARGSARGGGGWAGRRWNWLMHKCFNWRREELFNLAGESDRQWNATIGLYKDKVNGNALYDASRRFFFMKIIADCRATVRFSTNAATRPGNTTFKVSENTSNLTNSS